MIQLFHVNKVFQRDSAALSDLTLQIEKGEFVFVTGPSGAGKTTLLRLLFGAEQATDGQILVNQVNLARLSDQRKAKLRRKIGVVFQDFKLLPHRSVLENVLLPLEVSGLSTAEAQKRARVVLRNLGLETRMTLQPPRLSGGEQQRVAIARAVINDPLILLADEPTGNLDRENTEIVMRILHDVNARGTTVVVATHDQELIAKYPRRVVRLVQGRVALA